MFGLTKTLALLGIMIASAIIGGVIAIIEQLSRIGKKIDHLNITIKEISQNVDDLNITTKEIGQYIEEKNNPNGSQ